ncbi:hypothetical protein BTA51_00340 [Hahella sp. CCB-MM4]|uniref:FFLEELY motif protein n=1 Tax=Hahella sp. (strain CCB-MM4) TaxID=1926491 RepID=UPI000B9B470A|nr:hypothetical protein [Hahella sp. CCB-MM4]OZG74893.1 hypothetical protein BTA51_00340 [Hahella sp. CCB-MM4]
MSKEKLLSVQAKTPHTRRLQQLLLEYNEYRKQRDLHPLGEFIDYLGDWQITRLKRTHHDLYATPQYHDALEFLLKDLYSPKEFTQRDADLERIFPKMVKLLPDQALGTVANLIELNLLTQKLDEHMAVVLAEEMNVKEITETTYAEAFRRCDNLSVREHQIHLIQSSGEELEKYVKSRFLSFSLSITQGAAEMAGLGQLHQFLVRGMKAFKEIGGVKSLLDSIVLRERDILQRIYAGHETPFAT